MTSMFSERKNSSTSTPSGAAPEMPMRMRPPSRSRTFFSTSASAIRPRRLVGLFVAPTRNAQRPIARFTGLERSISPTTFA